MTKIEKVWVVLSSKEGICAQYLDDHKTWFSLVSANESKLPMLSKVAQDIANETGDVIRVVEFTRCKEVKFIEPNGKEKKH